MLPKCKTFKQITCATRAILKMDTLDAVSAFWLDYLAGCTPESHMQGSISAMDKSVH